jgi:hypothetical protein
MIPQSNQATETGRKKECKWFQLNPTGQFVHQILDISTYYSFYKEKQMKIPVMFSKRTLNSGLK